MRKLFWILVAVVIAVAVWLPTQLHQVTSSEQLSKTTAGQALLNVPVVTQVPDFSGYADVRDKKKAFFAFLAPLVQAENAQIELDRERILALQQKSQWSAKEQAWLLKIADDYGIDGDIEQANELFELLLRRVDLVPETLVLVQAANESGWGASRFAQDALNLFGQWCFTKGCGLVPDARADEARHEVRKFASVNASVRSYLRNINTHPAYFDLRSLRAERRAQGRDVRALDLTPGLLSYSERGEEYIAELNAMIRVNRPIIMDVLASGNAAVNDDAAPQNTDTVSSPSAPE
ncbi:MULTISPECIES: glucosaminidase domain-containing protein [Idiomarinaceae]|uniref:Bax protein n=2 Tax=Pseudidiomarina TaxID=2800384 RepID=A0A368V807_9GAMM|nr:MULTISPECIES: glucosaminidase domain-containing protein [Idiomarinaceae]MRJ40888.1 peptidoglycan hydrolase [Idiomarina sp. FeN1]NCU56692.1 peptidoglycan hydrolase [Idiomarina sp. FenA--70]NCU59072.1 peptidoglycan hydrolase [Idiomarina sp. FenBw--71]PWW15167.1 Bax protein [Pseudidiomarina maritima]RBP91711.1 Bax protein [Pseudidiomarina tainanensis]